MRLYVGNVDYSTTNQQLLDLFSQHAYVEQAYVVTDRETRHSRGFGFVTIQNT